ncbi:MAG: DUF4891 domain-containing protein [Bacteroides sp.]|nr:DUF4891 domain-containing protein [Bacteroides sp.]
MRILLFLLLSLFVMLSACRNGGQSGNGKQESGVEHVDTTLKATAIFWVDKEKNVYSKQKRDPLPVRTVKAKVNIFTTGRVEVLSYVKPQSKQLEKYMQERLEVFRVAKVMLDSGYVKPGEQYVQLRYMPQKMRQ